MNAAPTASATALRKSWKKRSGASADVVLTRIPAMARMCKKSTQEVQAERSRRRRAWPRREGFTLRSRGAALVAEAGQQRCHQSHRHGSGERRLAGVTVSGWGRLKVRPCLQGAVLLHDWPPTSGPQEGGGCVPPRTNSPHWGAESETVIRSHSEATYDREELAGNKRETCAGRRARRGKDRSVRKGCSLGAGASRKGNESDVQLIQQYAGRLPVTHWISTAVAVERRSGLHE